jgi:ferredoxin
MYHQIRDTPNIAISGMTPDYIVVRVEGAVTFTDEKAFLENLIKGKDGMYAGKTDLLEMFFIADGTGEIFDLSSDLPTRLLFAFGNARIRERGYQITGTCIACGICKESCTCNAIREGDMYQIDSVRCLHCGRCYEKCPENAIIPINISPGS